MTKMDEIESLRLGPGAYEPKMVRDDTCLVDYKTSLKKTEPFVNVYTRL